MTPIHHSIHPIIADYGWGLQRAMRQEMIRQFNANQGDAKIEALRKMMGAGGGQAQGALGIQNDAGTSTDTCILSIMTHSVIHLNAMTHPTINTPYLYSQRHT